MQKLDLLYGVIHPAQGKCYHHRIWLQGGGEISEKGDEKTIGVHGKARKREFGLLRDNSWK